MSRKIVFASAALAALFVLAQAPLTGQETGNLVGKIADKAGFPLPGAYIYVTSPSSIGVRNFITSETGRYGLLGLTPGTYKLTVEMPGFKTINVENIIVQPGATVMADVKMEPSEIEEEVTSRGAVSPLDRKSARQAVNLDHDLLTRLPLRRDFTSILALVPGVVFAKDTPGFSAAVDGGTVTSNLFAQDGVNVTDPTSGGSLSRFNVDVIDEVAVEVAAHPVERGTVQGAYINVISRYGGNTGAGSLRLAYTGSGFSKQLFSTAELSDLSSAAMPTLDRANFDLSLTSGGPVLKDIAWYFFNIRYRYLSQNTPFRHTVDPVRGVNPVYLFQDKDFSGEFKLTTRVAQKYQASAELIFSGINEPVYQPDVAFNRTQSATHTLDGGSFFLLKGGLLYDIGQATIADLSVGYVSQKQPLLLNSVGAPKVSYQDLGTGLLFGSGPYNDRQESKDFKGSAQITRLQDRFLGVSHELVAGADYGTLSAQSSAWKTNALFMDYFNGSPYLYGQAVSPTTGNTVGKGLIGFTIDPAIEGQMTVRREVRQLGAFVRDTLTFGGRVALSLGVRFDHADVRFPSFAKGAVGSDIALALGDTLIKPTYTINPFSTVALGAWDGVIKWNTVYPRAGIVIDLTGNGRTMVKGSYAKVPESLGVGYAKVLDPFPVSDVRNFVWYDENADGLVNATDTFTLVPFNYGAYLPASFLKRVQSGMDPSVIDEWTAAVDQEITRNSVFSIRYIARTQSNIVGEVLFDPASGQTWYDAQTAPAGWWVPFSTVVPGANGLGGTDVTVYLRSTTAPQPFGRIQNVPELRRRYQGLEFSFQKRMSSNWQLFASLVFSKSTGNAGLVWPWSMGISASPLSPNSFVNVSDAARTDLDRPVAFRLMGTFRFRWDIYLSAFLRVMSGAPWARSVTIVPPASFVTEHQTDDTPVTVFLEAPGSRRYDVEKNLDVRLQKDFLHGGRTRFSAYLDVFNFFGYKYRILDQNDGGLWAPTGEGTADGTRTFGGTYGKYVFASGVRTFAFSLCLGF